MWTIIIGIFSGFLASTLIKGRGLGCFLNLLIGIVGSYLGKWIFDLLHIAVIEESKTAMLAMSTVGSIMLLIIVSIFNKK